MSRTVFLHVGIAKTGTTYLQRTLFANQELLRRNGVLYPGPGPGAQFLGSLDLRGATFKGHVYPGADGMWSRLTAEANAFSGNTLISHETLAHASPQQIRRAVEAFSPARVEVVVTCRDLGRQVPAVWQEKLKNRGKVTYRVFLAQIFRAWPKRNIQRSGFWIPQDVVALTARWADVVGPEHVTVVTVPPSGADRQELWRRFALATELPDLPYDFGVEGNPSLGVAESEFLRRLNPLLKQQLDWPTYEIRIKRRLAERVLGELDTRGRLTVPERWRPKVEEIAAEAVEALDAAGYRVIGDLADLRPVFEPRQTPLPGELDDADVLDVALHVVARLVTQAPGQPSAGSAGRSMARQVSRSIARRLPRPIRHRLPF